MILAGCGGGGHSSLPAVQPGAGTASKATVSVSLTITIPTATTQAIAERAPKSVSPATQSVAISVNGGAIEYYYDPGDSIVN